MGRPHRAHKKPRLNRDQAIRRNRQDVFAVRLEADRQVGCKGRDGKPKRTYNSRKDARAKVREQRLAGDTTIEEYLCPTCGLFHIGHSRRED